MDASLHQYILRDPEFKNNASNLLIWTGSLILVISSLGCCSTVKRQPVLLYVYAAVLAIVFVLELGACISIFAYRSKFIGSVDEGLTRGAMYYYNDPQVSSEWDLIQERVKCCGNFTASDWQYPAEGVRIPSSCCIQTGSTTEEKCHEMYTQGCYLKVIEFLKEIIEVAAIGKTFFPLVGVILSCCLASVINKTKYEPMAKGFNPLE
ncbi:hypothetical protein YQE_04782, partial [Dendroctonus ponderosae]